MNMRDTVMVVGGRCHLIAPVAIRGGRSGGIMMVNENRGGCWGGCRQPEACCGEGRGERGGSVREEKCGRGQEVVTSWRTVEKAIKRSHPPRHAQRAGA